MIYVFLADGFEEIEALTAVDFLRRVNVEVTTVAVGGNLKVTGSHNITVLADILEKDIELNNNLQAVVLPGGMPGADNLEKSEYVNFALNYCYNNKKRIAAICAAPKVLGGKGLLNGINATCYPGFEKYLKGANIKNLKVVTDGNITTGCGPGAANLFALELARLFAEKDKYKALEESISCRD